MRGRPAELLVLALDIGSSSTRTALFDQNAARILETTASREYAVRYQANGGAELVPMQLLRAARSCLRETLRFRRESSLKNVPIGAVSGSGFWHSLLGLDRRGIPLTPIWTWADARSICDAQILRQKFSEREVQRRTGCMLRPSFWPAKLLWLRRTQPRLFRRVAQWVSPADWIFRELFGVARTSHSMASATGLYNLREQKWDREICKFSAVEETQLCVISDAPSKIEKGRGDLRDAEIFPSIGDGAAGNLGSGADEAGRVAINIGTSAAVRIVETNRNSRKNTLPFGLFRFVIDEKRTLLGGAVSNAGNLRQWCLRELQVDARPAEARRILSSASAASDPLVVLPFLVNERAPTWPDEMRGALVGLSQSTRASDILRATTTSVFYRLAQILELMETAVGSAQEVIVSGGILHSSPALRLLADALGRNLRISPESEASIRGAAVYALEKLGYEASGLTRGRIVKYSRTLAAEHRKRREQQVQLEKLLDDAGL